MELIPDVYIRLFGFKPSRGDATRLLIVQTAIKCIADDGLESITFDLIGDKLGLGKANIRYHFKTKEQLFFAAIKLVVMTAQEITLGMMKKADSPHEQLRAVITPLSIGTRNILNRVAFG